MGFQKWLRLKETGTSTADVAAYARPLFQSGRREFPELVTFGEEDPFFKKRKKGTRGPGKQNLPRS